MSEQVLPSYTVGMDMVSEDTALPRGAVREALNVTFDREGRARRRPGNTLISSGDTHSLWANKTGDRAFCVRGPDLCKCGTGLGVEPIATLPNAGPLSYTELADRIVAANASWIGQVMPNDAVIELGVEDGRIGTVDKSSVGGLPAGRYGIAAAFLRGDEEGGLSDIHFVQVDAGGGLSVALPQPLGADVSGVRLYRTTADGDVLYRAEDIPVGLAVYVLGNSPIGRAADNQRLRRMPPGHIVRAWRGRLLVARGRTLRFSEPFRYGLYSPRTGFIQEAHPILLVAPVEGGIFVGTRAGVIFYRGNTPGEWSRVRLGAAPPVQGTDRAVDLSVIDPKFQLGTTGEAAMWLSQTGFVIGLPDGQVVQPQSRRIRLEAQRGQLAIVGRQAVSMVI